MGGSVGKSRVSEILHYLFRNNGSARLQQRDASHFVLRFINIPKVTIMYIVKRKKRKYVCGLIPTLGMICN